MIDRDSIKSHVSRDRTYMGPTVDELIGMMSFRGDRLSIVKVIDKALIAF